METRDLYRDIWISMSLYGLYGCYDDFVWI